MLSYFTNLKQYVQVNDKQSTWLPIYFGVPQGSILASVLFNIYIAKLSTCIESNLIQYGGNTNIYKSSSKVNTIQTIRTLENDISDSWKGPKITVSFPTTINLKALHSLQERVTMIKASLSDQRVNLHNGSRQESYLV